MPWFQSRKDDSNSAQYIAEQEESIAALTAGGLPLNAQRRLERVRDGAFSAYTSDLTVNDLLLCREAGLRPICQVAGSAIFRAVGQVALMGTGEVTTLSDGINGARALALDRLRQEAEHVQAHAVLAVRLVGLRLPWSIHALEYTAIGTAVRLNDETDGTAPAISNLSGEEFWKLYRAGYWPLGICASTAVYNVYAPQLYAGAMGGYGWYNRELPHFSEGMYRARGIALHRVHAQAQALRASGIVGMTIDAAREAGESEMRDTSPARMTFTFSAVGTAITHVAQNSERRDPKTSMVLNVRQ